jgi:hypothetical protein
MRHSQPTASRNYLKVFDEEQNLIIINLKLEKDILEGDIKMLMRRMIKCDEVEQKNNKLFKNAVLILFIELITKELYQKI